SFLVPREDDSTINHFAQKVKELHRLKSTKLNAMIRYIDNRSKCRNIQLLNYFGELKKENCGQCDVCQEKSINNNSRNQEHMERDILGLLAIEKQTSRQLISCLPYKENDILIMLQKLLEEELIAVNSSNEYLKLT
ncbi:MAG: RecQ family zinc-binding domain-containing protein, partial [Flavobacteriaceae bacterium]